MSELLDYNVKISELQNQYRSQEARSQKKKRSQDNLEERKIEKRWWLNKTTRSDIRVISRLLLLNIKLAITNLYKYAMGRKVALPGDAVTEQEAGHTEAEVTTSVPGAGL